MPVSIVVGGQFGSEGKGKVALELVRRNGGENVTVVRVGGPNSGHTGYDRSGKKFALRQLPAGCIDRNVDVVFPAGSYLDVKILYDEIDKLDYPLDRISISPFARVISQADKDWEKEASLISAIGSTGSGVGGAVMASVARNAKNFSLTSHDAQHSEPLSEFVRDTTAMLAARLSAQSRVIIEGSQGFGLSLLDGGYWPKATARATTAAAALAEAGLGPLEVDDVTLVLRSFPIRVAGESGTLLNETTWEEVARFANRADDLKEYTTVTKKLRRVGWFDPEIVRRAISANQPSRIVLNHMDYIGDWKSTAVAKFVESIEARIGAPIDWLGFCGKTVRDRPLINQNV